MQPRQCSWSSERSGGAGGNYKDNGRCSSMKEVVSSLVAAVVAEMTMYGGWYGVVAALLLLCWRSEIELMTDDGRAWI